MHVAFITPVHERPAISRVCLRQRRTMMDALAGVMECTSVVVGSEPDLKVARELGMEAVRQDTNVLGLKLNDGIERAHELSATHMCFIGSDQWLHPDYLLGLDDDGDRVRTAHSFAVVTENGQELMLMDLPYVRGCGPKVIPLHRLKSWRPCDDTKLRSMDADLMEALDNNRRKTFRVVDTPELGGVRYVDFKNPVTQIHSSGQLRKFCQESLKPWGRLAEHYPPELVEEMREVYGR